MRTLIFFAICTCVANLKAQIPNRYVEEVFTNVVETNDVIFSTSVPQPKVNQFNIYVLLSGASVSVREYDTENVTLRMDIFQPEGDAAEDRPLILICFGGGFVQGSRDYWSMRLLAQGLARMGYVTASIDYRLGMDLFDKEIGARAVYRAIQDSRSAVRYFRANAGTYKIDPNKIFIGGHSSGGFVALHNLYLDKESERPDGTTATFSDGTPVTQDGNPLSDLSCLDCVGDNLGLNGKANAAFNLAGALGDLAFVENENEAPVLLFHSTDDGTVPYNTGEPFSDISGLILGSDLPIVFGSGPISQRFTDLGIENKFNSYTDRGHGVHENGTMALHSDILPGIGNWFFEQFLEPIALPITGVDALCVADKEQTYSLSNVGDFTYFDWQIEGGSFINKSTDSEEVTVSWDENAASHKLSVQSFLSNGAGADTTSFDVEVVTQASNEWTTSSNGLWDLGSNWSQGRVPLTCEDVIISNGGGEIEISLQEASNYKVKSLQLEDNVLLKIPSSSSMIIEGQ